MHVFLHMQDVGKESGLGEKCKLFKSFEDITIVKHGVKYADNNDFSSKSKNYSEVYFDYPLYDDDGTKGLPMHTECWNLAKNKLKHELKFEDFLFNKNKISSFLTFFTKIEA